jgi:oligopeptidase B
MKGMSHNTFLIYFSYTTAEKLAALGNSAGGMVVCAAANVKPDLFGVVVADVPYVDVFGSVVDKESGV